MRITRSPDERRIGSRAVAYDSSREGSSSGCGWVAAQRANAGSLQRCLPEIQPDNPKIEPKTTAACRSLIRNHINAAMKTPSPTPRPRGCTAAAYLMRK